MLKKNEPQGTDNSSTQKTSANNYEPLHQAETEGETEHEGKDPAPPPIFIPGITYVQRITATIEQVINRSDYTLKIINSDTMKIITNWNITKKEIYYK
jgi:hypothetical protein